MKYKKQKVKTTPVFPLYQKYVELPEPKREKCYPMTKLIGLFSFVFVLILFMV